MAIEKASWEYQVFGNATSPSLVAAMTCGDPQAWKTIVEIWGPVLIQHCRRRSFQFSDAEEIAQNVLLKMYSAITRGNFQRDGQRKRLRHWVFAILANEIKTFCAKNQKSPKSPGGSAHQMALADLPEQSQSDEFETLLVARILAVIKNDFEESTWKAFELYHFQNFQVAEIVELMAIKAGTIRQKIFRVVQRVREELAAEIAIDA
jgi:RNA polymerase sigma-70 factor, ECF subfamily